MAYRAYLELLFKLFEKHVLIFPVRAKVFVEIRTKFFEELAPDRFPVIHKHILKEITEFRHLIFRQERNGAQIYGLFQCLRCKGVVSRMAAGIPLDTASFKSLKPLTPMISSMTISYMWFARYSRAVS